MIGAIGNKIRPSRAQCFGIGEDTAAPAKPAAYGVGREWMQGLADGVSALI